MCQPVTPLTGNNTMPHPSADRSTNSVHHPLNSSSPKLFKSSKTLISSHTHAITDFTPERCETSRKGIKPVNSVVNWDSLFISAPWDPWGAPRGAGGIRDLLWAIFHRLGGDGKGAITAPTHFVSCSGRIWHVYTHPSCSCISHPPVLSLAFNPE